MQWLWRGGGAGRARGRLRRGLRYAAVIPIVGASALVGEVFYRLTGSDRLSSIFLSGVIVSAMLLGSGPAYLAAVLAFWVFTFQVDPRFQLTFGSADDLNSLVVFLVVSVLMGALTGRMREEAARAAARQRVSAALLDATQFFSATSDEQAIRTRLADALAQAAHGEAAVRDGRRSVVSPRGALAPDMLEALIEAERRARDGGRGVDSHGPWRVRPLWDGDAYLGIAAWRPKPGADLGVEDVTVLNVLVDTGAAAISRARLAAAKAEAETRARTEDLRNALLSSISHDLRTPLASILASASSLREFGAGFDDATRADLAATIQEEAERLDSFVANLLSMTRLEAGALSIERAPFSVAEVVERTLARRRVADSVSWSPPARRAPMALGDPQLFEQALGNVVENALRYSGGAAVRVVAEAEGGRVGVKVLDEGPGVAADDVERIFEKFYRGRTAPRAPGTGLGLSIARGLMRAMGGEAAAANRGDGAGLAITLSLAAAAP